MPVNSIIQRTLDKWGESLVKRVALGGGCRYWQKNYPEWNFKIFRKL